MIHRGDFFYRDLSDLNLNGIFGIFILIKLLSYIPLYPVPASRKKKKWFSSSVDMEFTPKGLKKEFEGRNVAPTRSEIVFTLNSIWVSPIQVSIGAEGEGYMIESQTLNSLMEYTYNVKVMNKVEQTVALIASRDQSRFRKYASSFSLLRLITLF